MFRADKRFNSALFNFYSGSSKNTINGKRFDFEIYFVHMAKTTQNGIITSVMDLILNVKNFD